MWVPAHGGGVAPNAYADSIAKSHLGAEVAVEPWLDTDRVCVYAVQAGMAPQRAWQSSICTADSTAMDSPAVIEVVLVEAVALAPAEAAVCIATTSSQSRPHSFFTLSAT